MSRTKILIGVCVIAMALSASMSLGARRGGGKKSPAESQQPNPQDRQSTPKGALHYYDEADADGGVKVARAFYHAQNEDQKKLADAMAKADVAVARLSQAAKKAFGEEDLPLIRHALRDQTAQDIDAAKETVTGDTCTIVWADGRQPLPLIKVKGAWKVNVAEIIKLFGEESSVDVYVDLYKSAAGVIDDLTQEIASGRFANAHLAERVILRRMSALLGDE